MPTVHEMEDQVELELPMQDGMSDFRSHWRLFIPTLVIFLAYGLCLAYLWATGRVDSGLFRMFAIVTAVGVPLLAAHAFLRFETVCVRLEDDCIKARPGWPKDKSIEIPNELVTDIFVKRGLAGRLMGGDTLIIETGTGTQIAIADLEDPEGVVNQFKSKANRTS